jgi:hypothetical protein
MGAFYGSVHVRTGETADLRRVLEELAADGKTRFLMGRPASGWTAVYPSGGGQDFAISAAIAARLAGPVIHLLVHDDDLFAYRLYDAGGVIDEYDSNPDYFQPSPPARWKETEGRPEALAALAGGGDPAELARILSRDGTEADPFRATSQMARVAARLGIANVETSYEYVQAGEVEGIKGWKQFVHVPDLTAEKEAKRRRRAEVTAALKRLQHDGVLLVAKKAATGRYGLPSPPVFCASPEGGFLVAWSSADAPLVTTIERWREPWHEPSDPGLGIQSTVSRMSASPDGRFLAVDHASRQRATGVFQWMTDLFDVRDRRLVTTVATPRLANHVAFTDDGSLLICRSPGELRLVSTDDGRVAQALTMGTGASAAVHPDGHWLVADVRDGHACGVALVDLDQMRLVRFLGTARNDFATWMAEVAAGNAATGFRPQEVPNKVAFTPDGQVLIVGVDDGVRIYSWNEVLDAHGSLPPSRACADSALVRVDSGVLRHSYGFAWDAPRARVLSPALDGHVHALGLASGKATVILEVPGTPPLCGLEIACDGTTLALIAQPGLFDRGRRPPPVWQVWNLESLESGPARGGR